MRVSRESAVGASSDAESRNSLRRDAETFPAIISYIIQAHLNIWLKYTTRVIFYKFVPIHEHL